MLSGPGANRRPIRKGRIAARKESVVSTAKDPMMALKAMGEPAYTDPNTVVIHPTTNVAAKGFLCWGEMVPMCEENGTAPSRASVHNVRPDVINAPMTPNKIGMKTSKQRSNVPHFEPPVACE